MGHSSSSGRRDGKIATVQFDDSPKRIWIGTTIPGKKMVRVLGYSGLDAGRELQRFYAEDDIATVFHGMAIVMHLILEKNERAMFGPAARDLVGASPVGWQELYGALVTDVRDFLKLRYRAKGIEDSSPAELIGQAQSFEITLPDWIGDPKMVVNFAISTLGALSLGEDYLVFMPTIQGLRGLFSGAHRKMSPGAGREPWD